MNKYKFLILVILYCFFCSKFVLSHSKNDTIDIPCQEIEIGCMNLKGGNRFIINNNYEYQKLLENKSNHRNCLVYMLPQINFNKYTLIGAHVSSGGEITYKVEKTPSVKSYNITYYTTKRGFTRVLRIQSVWFLIPKTEANYSINFFTNLKMKR